MRKSTGFLIAVIALAALLAAGWAGFTRVRQVVQPAPVCGGDAEAATTPPAQLVSAADFLAQGDFDYDQGRCAAAVADYTRALELDPQLAEAYNNRAYTNMALQNYAASLPDLDQAIALRPDYVNALMNRGDIYNYYYSIDYDKAVADYDRVLALAPEHTSVCGHRLLAQQHGWNPLVLLAVVTQGVRAGCG